MRIVAGLILVLLLPAFSMAATAADTDKMTTYAVILGRCTGCGIETSSAAGRVGAWMDRTFYGAEKSQMMKIFIIGMEREARAQKQGQSPDSCASLRNTCASFPWP